MNWKDILIAGTLNCIKLVGFTWVTFLLTKDRNLALVVMVLLLAGLGETR